MKLLPHRSLLAVALAPLIAFGGCTAHTQPAPLPSVQLSNEWSEAALMNAVTTVADWQLAHPAKHSLYDWTQSAFYAGVMSLASVSPDPKYVAAMLSVGKNLGFQLGPRWGHADDHAVGQTYAQLYMLDHTPAILTGMLRVFEPMLTMPFSEPLVWNDDVHLREWAWCDALFMSPPALAYVARATGDRRYLDLMSKLWWKTTDFLYDKEEHLYFRDSRYFDKREPNGKKVFWSRGNGWVLAGLARVLSALPADDPLRSRFEALFVQMANTILAHQPADGFWRASLLDPQSVPNPESSGSGFFVFGMAAGVNMGLLPRATFEPAIRKGWDALIRAVGADGKLGFVQQIGHSPGSATIDTTEVYGPGAFLLAGVEILKMQVRTNMRARSFTVANPTAILRLDETVELPWQFITASLGADTIAGQLVIANETSGAVLPTQAFDKSGDGVVDSLLFQTHLMPNETQRFAVLRRSGGNAFAPPVTYPAAGRLVPERKDDVAWENGSVAYRVYGPALERTGEISSGIDVWSKRVRTPVIDKWYKSDDYHVDRGEGVDSYKVGTSRGCGGVGLWDGKELLVSRNFSRVKQLANGPLRVAFAFEYDSWGPANQQIVERKIVSLDRGHSLNRIELLWQATAPRLPLAVGIVKRGSQGEATAEQNGAFVTYWQPPEGDNGQTGCAVVLAGATGTHIETNDHHLLQTDISSGVPFVYLAGATWSKGLDIAKPRAWSAYAETMAARINAPPIVVIESTDPSSRHRR